MNAQKSRSQSIARVFEKDRARYDHPTSRTVRSEPEMFQRGAYSSTALAKVRARWQVQRQVEYRSTSVFLDLSKQLMEAGASVHQTAVAVRMAQDEYRHADMCETVARALGCKTLAPLTMVLPKVAMHLDVSRQVAALRNVILCTCISETIAVANFIVELEELSDPYLKSATRALLADEVLHGEYGFRFLEDWAPFLASEPQAKAQVSAYLRFAFAFAEQELVGTDDHESATREERSLGLLDYQTRRGIFHDVMQNAVVPGLEQFDLSAAKAFQTRSIS
jgi:hypothetical protein